MSDIATSIVTAIATLCGAGIGSYTTFRLTRPYRQEVALSRAGILVEKRLALDVNQWELTEYGPEAKPMALTLPEREQIVAGMRNW